MDRIEQVKFILSLSWDISSTMPTEVNPSDADEIVGWWLNSDDLPERPYWWDEHDTRLLVQWVGDQL